MRDDATQWGLRTLSVGVPAHLTLEIGMSVYMQHKSGDVRAILEYVDHDLLTHEDQRRLLESLAGDKGIVSQSDAETLFAWAIGTIINHGLLQSVMHGKTRPHVYDGKIAFEETT